MAVRVCGPHDLRKSVKKRLKPTFFIILCLRHRSLALKSFRNPAFHRLFTDLMISSSGIVIKYLRCGIKQDPCKVVTIVYIIQRWIRNLLVTCVILRNQCVWVMLLIMFAPLLAEAADLSEFANGRCYIINPNNQDEWNVPLRELPQTNAKEIGYVDINHCVLSSTESLDIDDKRWVHLIEPDGWIEPPPIGWTKNGSF